VLVFFLLGHRLVSFSDLTNDLGFALNGLNPELKCLTTNYLVFLEREGQDIESLKLIFLLSTNTMLGSLYLSSLSFSPTPFRFIEAIISVYCLFY
jgi:hypothetical protein